MCPKKKYLKNRFFLPRYVKHSLYGNIVHNVAKERKHVLFNLSNIYRHYNIDATHNTKSIPWCMAPSNKIVKLLWPAVVLLLTTAAYVIFIEIDVSFAWISRGVSLFPFSSLSAYQEWQKCLCFTHAVASRCAVED